jgi:hypothetical protein
VGPGCQARARALLDCLGRGRRGGSGRAKRGVGWLGPEMAQPRGEFFLFLFLFSISHFHFLFLFIFYFLFF